MRFFSRPGAEQPTEPEIVQRLRDAGAKVQPASGLPTAIEIDHSATDEQLEQLAQLDTLEELTLNWCYGISDAGVSHLARLPRLVELQLNGAQIDGSGLAAFAGHASLERLHLDGAAVQTAALAHVARIPNLSTLFLRYTGIGNDALPQLQPLTRLAVLHLDGSQITGAGLPALRQLKKLEVLSLPSSIQGPDLQQLNGFGRLRWIWLGDANVDEASVAALKSTLNPMCSVTWRRKRPESEA